jgi:SP family general alpha glucoside:H+ symporter-like MFS transporter
MTVESEVAYAVKSEVAYAVNANNESPGHEHGLWTSDEDMVEGAKTASDIEHSMSISECIRTYKRAIFWSVIVTLSTTMESYDLQLIGSFTDIHLFRKNMVSCIAMGSTRFLPIGRLP